MLPATATEPEVATLPATAAEPAVAMLPATRHRPAVATLPATAALPATAELPATATLPDAAGCRHDGDTIRPVDARPRRTVDDRAGAASTEHRVLLASVTTTRARRLGRAATRGDQPASWSTEMIPGAARRRSITSAGTAAVGAISITAVPLTLARPTSMSAMFTPASPSMVPTTPITPGGRRS